jgi:AraC-like DNA-binding protein
VVNLDQGGFASGHTRLRPPPQDLADLVDCSFVRRDDSAARPAGGAAWRLVPEANANIVVVSRETRRGRIMDGSLVGARSRFKDTDVSSRRLTVGVRLRPGALPLIARARATAFTDTAFSLDEVFGAVGRRATARLDESDPDETLRVIFQLLRDVTARDRDRSHQRIIAAASVASSVAVLARSLAMPVRTLQVRTQESIGLSPKHLLRILRLHRALESYPSSTGWAAVATSTGFADQPHLVRELRSLLGESPSRWFARAVRSADSS